MRLNFIRECIDNRNFLITFHAYRMLYERKIERSEMISALYNGEIIERNLKDKPYPSFLVLGYLKSGDPLHIKCSSRKVSKRLRIVTVYEPKDEEWEKNYKTRKKKR